MSPYSLPLANYRCTCGRLLFKGALFSSLIEIKCKRCNEITSFATRSLEPEREYGLIVDVIGRVVTISDTASEILGYDIEELVGKPLSALNAYADRTEQTLFERIPHGVRIALDRTHRTKQGTVLPIRMQVSAASSRDGQFVCVCHVVPKEAQAMVRDTETPASLVRHDMLCELDSEGQCVYVTDTFAQLLGKHVATILGSPLYFLLNADDAISYKNIFPIMKSQRSAFSVTVSLHAERERVSVRLHHLPSYRDDGSLRGYTVLIEKK